MVTKLIKSGMAFAERPGAFFRYRNHEARAAYHTLARFGHARTFLSRCLNTTANQNGLSINEREGYAVVPPAKAVGYDVAAVLAEVRAIVASCDVPAIRAGSIKSYLLTLKKNEDFSRDSAIYRFVTSPSIVGAAAAYLKCFPILTYIAIWYSPNDSAQNDGSQRFHLDHEDYRQVKGFLFIEDIDAATGPFTLINAEDSAKVQRGINYRMTPDEKRVDDDVVFGITGPGRAVPLTGEAGTVALIDTSRCFHYGSREGRKPRIMLTFQFMTPFAYVMPWNWRKRKHLEHLHSESLSVAEQKLLGMKI